MLSRLLRKPKPIKLGRWRVTDDIKIQEQRINWANHDHCGSEICEKKFDKNKQKEKKEIQKNIKINVDEKKLFTKMEPFDEMLPFCM